MSSCYYPMLAYKTIHGNIIFKDTDPEIVSQLQLPCGKCIGCRLNHAESWAIRMVHEAQQHEQNCFVTLTYNNENLPENGNLRYEDVTKFIKKLRKVLEKTKVKIKYYRVGEYGENFSRPHYHLIIFGFDFTAKLRYRGKENIHSEWRIKDNNRYYISTLLSELWGVGHAELTEVNYNTCMYVAKYVTKKINGKQREEHYQRIRPDGEIVSVEPEKASMSRKEAIGKKWLEEFWQDVYPHDHVIYEAKKLKCPKYYDKWIEKNNPQLYEKIKLEREKNTKQRLQVDLTRTHQVKLLQHKQHSSELNGCSTLNEVDELLVDYYKRSHNEYHLKEKQNV